MLEATIFLAKINSLNPPINKDSKMSAPLILKRDYRH